MGISWGLSARILQLSTLVCLGLWSQQIFAAISIVLKPKTPAMGEDVLLFTGGVTGNISFFIWYRGDKINSSSQILFYNLATLPEQMFPPYEGRVRGFPNGSMEITGLNRNDSGSYTVLIQTTTQQEEATVTITVYGRISNVSITSNSTSAYLWADKDSVRLTCTALGDEPRFSWSKNGTFLPQDPRYHISANNESLTISPVIQSDATVFTCTAFNSVSQRSSFLTLNIYNVDDCNTFWCHYKEVIIVIGILVGLALIGLTVYLVLRSKKKTSNPEQTGKIFDSSDHIYADVNYCQENSSINMTVCPTYTNVINSRGNNFVNVTDLNEYVDISMHCPIRPSTNTDSTAGNLLYMDLQVRDVALYRTLK
uniref:Carcinoembryonic antigen-related cell adhesion molecule 21-like isoform X2 n=1 Tax=Geotrypetes seraphini TaxID=260995 RepID=A0A6P8SIU7_GEOSA|nr:carcinoembryonic antigen-related cell adhesion molecule 21-like isoform X2 [Geotrypetes seraphini]